MKIKLSKEELQLLLQAFKGKLPDIVFKESKPEEKKD